VDLQRTILTAILKLEEAYALIVLHSKQADHARKKLLNRPLIVQDIQVLEEKHEY
jgi:hypothetical protein